MSKKLSIRFMVASKSGRRATSWNCWTHIGVGKSDWYLACRELGSKLKVSMHQSCVWHYAYTQQFFKDDINTSSDKLDNRFISTWCRPQEITPGMTLALRIITPYSAVTIAYDISKYRNIVTIPAPPNNRALEVDIFMVKSHVLTSNWPGRNSMNTELIGSISLYNGEKVWVVYHIIDMPNLEFPSGVPRYFKGRTKGDISGANIRVLAFKDERDGSRSLWDFAGEVVAKKG